MKASDIYLPCDWPDSIRPAMIHAANLARHDMIYIHATSEEKDQSFHSREASRIERLLNEIAQLNEYVRILQTRISKIPAKHRPHYSPQERMAILMFKTAKGWSNKQAADAFNISETTISHWMNELEQNGEHALVQTPTPVNKYPDFIEHGAQALKVLFPRFGKKSIVEFFIRAGLFLSSSTIGRRLKSTFRNPPPIICSSEPEDSINKTKGHVVKSRHPNHTWMIDLTAVPVFSGFNTPWFFKCLPQCFPFCWWVMIVIDHFSRKVVGSAIFFRVPTAEEVIAVMEKTIKKNKIKPKYSISDQGIQFHAPANAKDNENHPFVKWCKRKKIKHRYGAVGEYGSIAIIERFMRSLKDECTRQIVVPVNPGDMLYELALFIEWYNEYRPHQSLKARTPQEVYSNSPPLSKVEVERNCDLPDFELKIGFLEGRKHLPIIELKKAA